MMAASIAERLREFYRRLAAAPAVRTADEALALVSQTLDAVEDELSGIPKRVPPPPKNEFDGRMYPPEEESIRRREDGGLTFRTRMHRVDLSAGGTVIITHVRSGA